MTQPSALAQVPSRSVRIVHIGAGPAGIMTLERVLAQHRRDTGHIPLEVHLIDPHEPGGGRIWRRNQSPLLKLNTMLRDDAVFTDESCELFGPIEPGPSLAEWIHELHTGQISRPSWWDDRLEQEISVATEQSFPSRRLNSAYLSWGYEEILRRAHPNVSVRWHQDLAVAVDTVDEIHHVSLKSGVTLHADVVIHTLGHNGSDASPASQRLKEFADANNLTYIPPAFTADVDYEWLHPQQSVLVRGMGLAAVDLVVLLTEGRGGVFTRTPTGKLRYTPSGLEPRLYMGSRRGVPYRSKTTSTLVGDSPKLEYLGQSFRDMVSRTDQLLDFDCDVWPLVAAELLTGYYRELFTGHPNRVHSSWPKFQTHLRHILQQTGGFQSRDLQQLIANHVPSESDRFDLASFDRPLAAPHRVDPTASRVDSAAVDRRVREHIDDDLRHRTTSEHSATQGLFMAMLHAYFAVSDVPQEKWNVRSRTHTLPKQWHTYFSYLASGPPGHRLEEFLALADAGILTFLGADLTLETSAASFVARGRAWTETGWVTSEISTHTLIDAWLPEAKAANSDNPLLRQLIASGQARELAVVDEQHSGSTGQLAITEDCRLPDTIRQFALGPFTSYPTGGAFTRPGLNSLPFRRHDHLAKCVLEAVKTVWAGEPLHAASGAVSNV